MAGQGIMQDFVRFSIPLWLRRVATMVPAVVVVAMGVDSTQALVMSQVVLSLVLPVPMVALLVLSGRRDVMGAFASRRATLVGAVVAAAIVLTLNLVLLLQTVDVSVSFLGSN
jgi:manganese transport protein